ncbi:MAG: 50S ribosomal protein L9 [Clostridiales bacterium]|nr:50S ribosomal protein L9 [Clostridiales bacterium]
MKVILQQDVKGSGRQGEVVNVSDGYARNYLFPRKLAIPADTGRLNSLRRHQEAQAHRAATAEDRARDEAARIEGKSVRVAVRSGENGKLFGSVSTREVADALKQQLGLTFDRKKITLDEHIKQLGEYEVQLRFYPEVTATIKVLVTAEE